MGALAAFLFREIFCFIGRTFLWTEKGASEIGGPFYCFAYSIA